MNISKFMTHFMLFPPEGSTSQVHIKPCNIQDKRSTNRESAILMAVFEKTLPLQIINNNATKNLPTSKQLVSPQHTAELHVLLTVRSLHLRHHPGQICFPGGKVEEQDNSISDTARREALEEINLQCKQSNILGVLPNHQTLTGFNISPIVALVKQPEDLLIDENEVSEIFSVPLNFLLDLNNYISIHTKRNNKHHTIHYITYKKYKIWGATAAILKDMATQFSCKN